jgi:anti-sigma regulatory factor (Ser/Thr protein kinase)
MGKPEEMVRLDVPAEAAFVGVARSVITTVATLLEELDDDRLEDLRLAVSEACTSAVAGGPDRRMVLRCLRDTDHVEVWIESSGSAPLANDEAGFGLQLINALVDEARFEESSGTRAVRLSMSFT